MLKLCSEIGRRLNSTTKPSLQACRQLCQTTALFVTKETRNDESTNAAPTIKWDKIYQMNEINYLSIVSKLKLYQGIASVVTIPAAYIGQTLNIVPNDVPVALIAMTVTSLSLLCAYSAALNNTIGIIYVCTKNVNIRFAYVDFWGRRNHYDTTIDNIAEPSAKTLFGLFQFVRLRDGTKTFKLATRHGNINDFELYEKLFGRLQK